MATTDRAAALHEPLCRDLMQRFVLQTPDSDMIGRVEYLIETGVIDAARLFEVVTSLEEGIDLKSVDGCDLADNSNCKITGRFGPVNGQSTAFGWRVKVSNCIGDARVLLHNPDTNETFTGVIPYAEFKDQKWLTITLCKGKKKFGRWTPFITESKAPVVKPQRTMKDKFWEFIFGAGG